MLIIIYRVGLDKVREGQWNKSWEPITKMQERKEEGQRSSKRAWCAGTRWERSCWGLKSELCVKTDETVQSNLCPSHVPVFLLKHKSGFKMYFLVPFPSCSPFQIPGLTQATSPQSLTLKNTFVNQCSISRHTLKRHFNWYFNLNFPLGGIISNSGCRTSTKPGQPSWGRIANCVLESEMLI